MFVAFSRQNDAGSLARTDEESKQSRSQSSSRRIPKVFILAKVNRNKRREVWRQVTIVAKFLDQNNLSWQRRPFGLSNDGRKVWDTVLFLNHAQEYMSTFSLFSVISAGLGFVEIQKPWQPRQRDVTTSPLLSRFSAKMHSQPQSLRVWECARKICLLYMHRRALGRDWPKWHPWFTRAHYWVLRKSRSRSSPHLRPHLHRLNMFNWTRFWKMKNRLD